MGDSSELRQLVTEEGLNPSHTYRLGVTALHETSEYGHVDATKALIDLSAEVNRQVRVTLITYPIFVYCCVIVLLVLNLTIINEIHIFLEGYGSCIVCLSVML